MRLSKRIYILFFILIFYQQAFSQNPVDTIFSRAQLPGKYLSEINGKIKKYNNRINAKTEKTLARLSRWENKVHSVLEKANPEAAQRLFGNNQTTFSSLLQKVKEGEATAEKYKAEYDSYTDKLSTCIKYLQQEEGKIDSQVTKPLNRAAESMQALQQNLDKAASIKEFIKERKKQLFAQAVKYIGQSKYLSKINKESYYYTATLQNYKEIFSDPQKAEARVKEALNKIPAFQQFMQKNSQLASLFNLPGNSAGSSTASLAGLQTRAFVQTMIQQRLAAGGSNAIAQVQQNLSQAQAEINKLKDRISKINGGSSDIEIPDFKPNNQKSKTLSQRMEYGFYIQFSKNNSLIPSCTHLAGTVGYKINDKSEAGIGMSYKVGLGTLQHIRISSQGLGLRSYLDWKAPFGSKVRMLTGLYISGGYEMNYNSGFKIIEQLKNDNVWQRSALLGISKKYQISKKLKGNMQLLYDFLAREHVPVSQPVIFRVGYNF